MSISPALSHPTDIRTVLYCTRTVSETAVEQLRPSIADSRSLTSGERKTVGVPRTAGNGCCAKQVAANKPPHLGRLQRSRVPAIGYNHAAASGCIVCRAPESAGLPAMNRPCTRTHNYCTGGSRDNGSSVIALPTILRFRRYEGSPTVLFCIQPEKLAKWASCSCACASDARATDRFLGLQSPRSAGRARIPAEPILAFYNTMRQGCSCLGSFPHPAYRRSRRKTLEVETGFRAICRAATRAEPSLTGFCRRYEIASAAASQASMTL